MTFLTIAVLLAFLVTAVAFVRTRLRALRLGRERYIRRCTFSRDIFDKVRAKYPTLDEKGLYLVARALRQYFLAYLRADARHQIGMPSKVVDEMWHQFILDTTKYTDFCKQAFGTYFHHFPVSKVHKGSEIAQGLQRTFKLACLEENINPARPVRLPLLFAIDAKLAIPDGNLYRLPFPVEALEKTDSSSSACGGVVYSDTDKRSSWFDTGGDSDGGWFGTDGGGDGDSDGGDGGDAGCGGGD